MGQPYVGEIRMFGGNFAPAGWMLCQGQLLPISEQEVLFQLIGTTYGGDGQATFALPNLASRVPIHMGTGPSGTTYQMGEMNGTEQETLNSNQIPNHTHNLLAANVPGTSQIPSGGMYAQAQSTQPGLVTYGLDSVAAMSGSAIGTTGGSQPHENIQPFLCVNFIISLFGVFPSQT
jgi:microcystin-dependent protein